MFSPLFAPLIPSMYQEGCCLLKYRDRFDTYRRDNQAAEQLITSCGGATFLPLFVPHRSLTYRFLASTERPIPPTQEGDYVETLWALGRYILYRYSQAVEQLLVG